MKRFFLPLFVVIASFQFHGQESGRDTVQIQTEVTNPIPDPTDSSVTYAQFPGGESALYTFIAENVHYPESALNRGIEGVVYIRFKVNSFGKVVDAGVDRGIPAGPELEEEALRVVRSSPVWVPATMNGKAVACEYMLPVRFHIRDPKAERKARRALRKAAKVDR